jgi:2-polyprenyl-3-methyl-5-hydroxy-6-metoxy-1,4-benzoquinol methylase
MSEDKKKLKVLDIGPGIEQYHIATPESMFGNLGELDVTTLDINPDNKPDIVHDIREVFPEAMNNAYDLILCSHVLEHIEYRVLFGTLNNIIRALKVQGSLWVIVPSLEWACQKILNGEYTPGVTGVFWGGQQDETDYHKCGFRLQDIRALMEYSGLIIGRATQAYYKSIVDGKSELVMQNVVAGTKVLSNESKDAAKAIE